MRIIAGYLLIAFSLVLSASVLTFSPGESAFFTSHVGKADQNILGSFGNIMAGPPVLFYGLYASLLLCFGVLSLGVNILTGRKPGTIILKSMLFIFSSMSLSAATAASLKNADFSTSGIIGMAIAQTMASWLPLTVTAVLFYTFFALSLFSTMKLFKALTWALARTFGKIVLSPFALLGLLKKAPDETQQRPSPERVWNDEPAPMPVKTSDQVAQNTGVNTADDIYAPRPVPEFLKKQPLDPASSVPVADKSAPPDWLVSAEGRGRLRQSISTVISTELGETPAEALSAVQDQTIRPMPPVSGIINLGPELIDSREENALYLDSGSGFTALEDSIINTEEPMNESSFIESAVPVQKTEQPAVRDEEDAVTVKTEKKKKTRADDSEPEAPLFKGSHFIFPSAAALEKGFDNFSRAEEVEEIEKVSRIIEATFESFKIPIKVSGHSRGPAITRYEIVPPSGLKLKNIVNLTDDLALNLGTRNIRIVGPIGNRSLIGVEVPNRHRHSVVLRDIIESPEFAKSRAQLPMILGKDITGNILIEDLAETPHLLIAGTTGSGKSVYVNSLISGILFKKTADEVKFIFIDPKMVELELYNDIPHLLAPVIINPEEAIGVLEWTSQEMDRRYKVLSEFGVRNIVDYNREVKKINTVREKTKEEPMEHFPYIVVVIDEFANLMLRLPKETEKIISRLAAMARAVGIHLVVATQRPSVDVITGIIKANFPSRIAFRVSSQTDSRTILDKAGSERLLGRGDMLYINPGFTDTVRIQSPYVSNADVENIVRELKRNGKADYVIDPAELSNPRGSSGEGGELNADYREDPVFIDSLKAAVETGEISASGLQRRFRIGYNRASRIVEAMDKMRILGPVRGAGKPREVLIGQEDLVHYLDNM